MPVENGIPQIEISNGNGKENARLTNDPSLARSPQPYHRRKNGISDATLRTNHTGLQSTRASNEAIEGYSTAQHSILELRVKKQYPTSPSDSGTEADDESGVVLKGLPAPPIRWRKGLRENEGHGTGSPLLTPSYLDDDERRSFIECQLQGNPTLQDSALKNEEILRIRQKFTRRRRAELVRRTSETILLGVVGYVACGIDLMRLRKTMTPEVLSHMGVVLAIYLSYPFRLLYRHMSEKSNQSRPWSFLRIPAAFDPATLLYPVFLPLFVALSVASSYPAVLVTNLILSIASIPRAILPVHDDFLGHSAFQWMASLTPLVASQSLGRHSINNSQAVARLPCPETLTLLFPLHQALLPTLGYLTTTSLLPAELQLLSTAMVNLLLLSASPQALILQSLLWIGGVAVFMLCGRVLRWGVALARIPSWRFRHPRLRSRDGFVLLSAIDDCFHRRLGRWVSSINESEESSGEGRDCTASDSISKIRPKEPRLAVPDSYTTIPPLDGRVLLPAQGPVSRIHSDLSSVPKAPQTVERSQRRYTLPSYIAAPAGADSQNGSVPIRKVRSTPTRPRMFASMTWAQATATKWLFASYVYITVLAIIGWPIRKYVSHKALGGREPVGWALGYLLGHVPSFRYYVLSSSSFENWIPLPEPYDIYDNSAQPDWATVLDRRLQGAANTRLVVCIYCLGSIAAGIAIVFRLKDYVEVDTRRKVFHGMMVLMFLPTAFVDPAFVALAFAIILAVFLLLDLFRASQLPPLSKPLTAFLAPYVDGRDYRGPVIVSPLFLLIGCAMPLWLSLAVVDRTGESPWEGWEVSRRELSMVSGVVCVGLGDAAASLVGRRFGRRRWCWSGGKSLEGSLAFALAVILGLSLGRAWLLLGGWAGDSGDSWSVTVGKAAVAATGASLTEAVLTGGNDNVVVPIILWLLVRGLRM